MEENKNLEYYIERIRRMKRNSAGKLLAPHKPILLLSVASLIEKGYIVENKIVLDDALISEFKKFWNNLVIGVDNPSTPRTSLEKELDLSNVKSYPFKCSIENPYFHLNSEPFWHLVKSWQWEERPKYTSVTMLQKHYSYAMLDEELFTLMQSSEFRRTITEYLKQII